MMSKEDTILTSLVRIKYLEWKIFKIYTMSSLSF